MSIISQEQKIIDLENEISFLKDRLYEEQEQNEYLRDKADKQQKEIEYLKGYTKVTGRVGGMTSE